MLLVWCLLVAVSKSEEDWFSFIEEPEELVPRRVRHSDFRLGEYRWGALPQYVDLPSAFDSRVQWPGCVKLCWQEEVCDESWPFGAFDIFEDHICTYYMQRVAIATESWPYCQNQAPHRSVQTSVRVWMALYWDDGPMDPTAPLWADESTRFVMCAKLPVSSYQPSHPFHYTGITSMKLAILQGGSVEACFRLYSDFRTHSSGVYVHSTGALEGLECMKVMGWQDDAWIGQAYSTNKEVVLFRMGQLDVEQFAIAIGLAE